jgi:hypothetical protein
MPTYITRRCRLKCPAGVRCVLRCSSWRVGGVAIAGMVLAHGVALPAL